MEEVFLLLILRKFKEEQENNKNIKKNLDYKCSKIVGENSRKKENNKNRI